MWYQYSLISFTIYYDRKNCFLSRKIFWNVCPLGLSSCPGNKGTYFITFDNMIFNNYCFLMLGFFFFFFFFLQVIIEIPYIFVLTIAFTAITFPMIGYYWSAYKVFWYIYSMFCTLLYFNYLGMMLIAITPSFSVAAILQSSFYTIFNLLAGFLIPRPVSFSLVKFLRIDERTYVKVFFVLFSCRESQNGGFGYTI